MEARTARFGSLASLFTTPARSLCGQLVPTPAGHGPRTRADHTAPPADPRAGGRCRGGESRPRFGQIPAYAGGASSGPPRCRNSSQLRTLPGDIVHGRRDRPAQKWPGPVHSSPAPGTAVAGRMLLGFGFFQPSVGPRAAQTVRRWRPLSRRDFKMARPARVDMRLRKPCVLALFLVFG